MIGRPVHLIATKYNGSPCWEEDLWYVMEQGSLLVLQGFFVRQPGIPTGPKQPRFDATRFLWSDRWYNVMRLTQRGAGLYGWYCTIATPAQFDGANVHYVDLDLRIMVAKDGQCQVQGEKEFAGNAALLAYPEDVVEQARRVVAEVTGLAGRREFPFQDRT